MGVLALAAAYFAAGQASLALQFDGLVAAIWLPVGIGAAALYLGGLRWWPAFVIGDLALADTSHPLGTALGVTAANVVEMLLIAVLLRYLLGPRSTLDRRQDVGGLLVAIVAGAVTSASIAVISMRLGDVIASADLWGVWRSWFLADASGSLVVIPLALAWAGWPPKRWRRRVTREGALMIGAVAALSVIALSAERPLPYVVFPALVWAALRFGQRGGTLAVAITSGVTVGITAGDLGAFTEHSITYRALSTQLYLAVAAITTLFLAAVVSERRRSLRELADARDRILAASDAERRRIERDLHDGAQQRLVMLRMRLALADDLVQRDPDAARRVIGELGAEVDSTIDDVRSLARAVYPTVLLDFGLAEALRSLARNAPVHTTVDVEGLERCRPAVETAVYFCCSEAVNNAAKHGDAATTVTISVRRHRDLHFEVRDDGPGFAVADVHAGHGLANMRDRIDAVGGTLEVRSRPGHGTIVAGTIANAEPPAPRR